MKQVHFWDLGGHPSFLDVRNEFYKHAQGVCTNSIIFQNYNHLIRLLINNDD